MKGGKKAGGGTLEQQVERLKGLLNKEEIKLAEDMSENQPNVVRLAFKMLDKPHRAKKELSAHERKAVISLIDISRDAAREYAIKCMSARGFSVQDANEVASELVGVK